MKQRTTNLFWGIVLIALGGIYLAQMLGYLNFKSLSEQFWTVAFAAASALFLLSYFLNGVRKWGWLFPALICAALAITLWMAHSNMLGSIIGMPILASIALPFYAGFAVNRKNTGLLIPAFVLSVVAIITLIADSARGEWIGALVLFSIGLPFLVVYLLDRTKRWALIPGYILTVLGAVTLLSGFTAGEWIGALVLYAIGLPFLLVYLYDRSKRWALIPAAALGIVGTIPLLTAIVSAEIVAPIIMFLFALPFFVVYLLGRKHWWALIPAGLFASIGLVAILSLLTANMQDKLAGVYNGTLFIGFAATFGGLWLLRKTQPTAWAWIPAAGLLATAILAFALGKLFTDYWPATLLLVVGVLLLMNVFIKKRPSVDPAGPEEKA